MTHSTSLPPAGKRITWMQLLVILLAILFLFSCKKADPASGSPYVLNKNLFFTFQAGSKSFTSYAFTDKNHLDYNDGAILTSKFGMDASGNAYSNVFISVIDTRGGGGPILNPNPILRLGNCKAGLALTHDNMQLPGEYRLATSAPFSQTLSGSQSGDQYQVDSVGFTLTITRTAALSTGGSFAEGNFSGTAIPIAGAPTPVPISGSFRLFIRQ